MGTASNLNFANGSLSINADFSMFLLVMPENCPAILPSCNKIYRTRVFICAFFQFLMFHTANYSDFQYFIRANPLKRLIFFSLTHIKNDRFNYLYALQLK